MPYVQQTWTDNVTPVDKSRMDHIEAGIGVADANALFSAVIALPGAPVDGQECVLVDVLAAPTYSWRMKWLAAAARWIYVGGSPIFVQVNTNENISSAAYVDAATLVSCVVPRAGSYLIAHGAALEGGTSSQTWATVKLGAAAASDNEGFVSDNNPSIHLSSYARQIRAVLAAADTIKQQYKVTGSVLPIQSRWLEVKPTYLT